jgi:hypothetical protein
MNKYKIYYTTGEAAQIFGICNLTFKRRFVDTKIFDFFKLPSGHKRFYKAQIDKYFKEAYPNFRSTE